jgi:CBS domain-containing protein
MLAHRTLESLGIAQKPVKKMCDTDLALRAFMNMQESNLTGLLVVDSSGNILGDISACELTEVVVDLSRLSLPVSEFITVSDRKVITCSPYVQLGGVIELMLENKVRRVYVTDNDNMPVGVVTITDILRTVQSNATLIDDCSTTASNNEFRDLPVSADLRDVPSAATLSPLPSVTSLTTFPECYSPMDGQSTASSPRRYSQPVTS